MKNNTILKLSTSEFYSVFKMSDFNEYTDTSGLHQKAAETLKHNRTIIWLTIIFFIITIILSWIFIYSPVARIENKVDFTTSFLRTEAKTAFDQGEEVFKFIKEVEEDFKDVVTDVNILFDEVCTHCKNNPFTETCLLIGPICRAREARKAAKLTSGVAVITPVTSNVISSVISNNGNTLSNGNTTNDVSGNTNGGNGDSNNGNVSTNDTTDDDACDDECPHHKKNKNDRRGTLRSGYYRYRTYH